MVFINLWNSLDNILPALRWPVLILAPVLWSLRDSYASPKEKDKNKYWHWLGWTLRALFAVYACPFNLLIAYGFYFWIIFDGLYNIWTNQPWGFIGSTAWTDRAIKYLGGHWVKFPGFAAAVIYLIIKNL